MSRLLVAGGTGSLGRHLVPLLLERGHEARVLSRSASAKVAPQVEVGRGDVLTGDNLAAAVEGVGTVIHAASNPRRHARETEVEGTGRILRAARDADVGHVIYVSIVGVDRHRFPYYKAKWEAEKVVESAGMPWTIQRATQFHDLLDYLLGRRVFVRTPHLAFQVVDPTEVSARLADLVEAGPSARAPDFGGPEVVPVARLRDERREIRGRSAALVPVPPVGFLADFDRGRHHCPGHREGRTTWSDWLRRDPSS